MATDIAFVLAVLAVVAPGVPTSLRAFLLTLAVVDDLGAIAIIAVFCTSELHLFPLLGAVASLGLYAWLQRNRGRVVWLTAPLALAAWVLVHATGVHATVAGVALGLLTRVVAANEEPSPGERADHLVRPVSAGVAVPVFALLSAGVPLSGSVLADVFADRVALGVLLGLVVGKFIGVFGSTVLAVWLGFARLAEDLRWRDVAAVSLLTGVGFTVSLLIGELAYGGTSRSEHVTAAILIASLAVTLPAALLFRPRTRGRVNGDRSG